MAFLPSAIIFVNQDLSANVETTLQTQLYITDTMYGSDFDARVAENPGYPDIIHGTQSRILVIRPFNDGYDGYNRWLADIVIFVKAGLAAIEKNKFAHHEDGYHFFDGYHHFDNINFWDNNFELRCRRRNTPGETFPVEYLTMQQLVKRYPVQGDHYIPCNVQNNILCPEHPEWNRPNLYPFGNSLVPMPGGRGADIIFPKCKCPGQVDCGNDCCNCEPFDF